MRVFSTTVVAALTFASAAGAQAPTWNIDPNHSAAQFAVKHLMVSTVRGQFEKMSGTIQWDGKDVKSIAVNVAIDAASVNTRVAMRDNDLRSANFFEVATYPTITFVSKAAEPAEGGKFRLLGALTMHGVTRDVWLDVEGPSAPLTQGPNLRTGASATTKIKRQDFNLTFNRAVEGAPVVADSIAITIDIEATRRP